MTKSRYLIILLLLLCSSSLFAQSSPPNWGGGADQNDFSFGFSFSYVSDYFKIVKKPDWRNPYYDPGVGKNITDSLRSINSPHQPGFAIGFLARYRITDNLEIRTNPTLIFADRELFYTYNDGTTQTKSVSPSTLDFPLSLKLKSERVGNVRAYILGGIKYSAALGGGGGIDNNQTDPIEKLVKNSKGYGSYEAGLGCDIYFEFFKLSPEIKLSNSLGNILIPGSEPYSTPISKLSLHSVVFSLIFE
jgi:hypothetical protein